MSKELTLGSLFDGSGGFPLGASLCGIKPVWASEIEPFPIRVTTKRFPNMKHLGDVSKLKGYEIEPVDIITFGSPCQDLSIAGRRSGLDGKKSSLFYEAIRIVKEMREKTNGEKPRYIVWENVLGVFSSNKGEDFFSVIKEIYKITGNQVINSRPKKWSNAGCILDENFSLAWRVFDARYWGVPQRRRRIYLVADFNGQSASQILFNKDSVSWDITKSKIKEQSFTKSFGEGTFNSINLKLYENHGQDTRFKGPLDLSPTVSASYGTGGNNQPFIVGKDENYDIRLTSKNTKNERANIYKTDTSRTIDTNGNNPNSNQGGVAIVDVFSIDRESFSSSKNYDRSPGIKVNDVNPTLKAHGPDAVAVPIYSTSKNSYHTKPSFNEANTLVASDYKDPPIINDIDEDKKYIVRRLIPTECARLQGFPDDWCDDLETKNPSKEEITFWSEVFETHRKALGKSKKQKTENQIRKWLENPYSDSAEYKMWGNGVALPNVFFVLNSILKHSN